MVAKVKIETEFSDSGAQTGIGKVQKSLTELNSGVEIAQKAAAMMGEAYKALIGDLLAYSDQVRDLSRVTGASTEESSRLIQVADDLQVEYGSLTQAAKSLAQDGIALTTEELAKASDEYLAITDAGGRAEYAVKKFGRAGLELTKILEQGGDALREMAAGQAENLVLTEAQTKAARELEIAQDGLEDSIQGVKYALANALIPVLNAAIKATEQLTAIQGGFSDVLQQHSKDVAKTAQSYEEYRTEMERAANVAGQTVSVTGELQMVTIGANGAIRTAATGVKLLSDAEFIAAQNSGKMKQALEDTKLAAQNAGPGGFDEFESTLGSSSLKVQDFGRILEDLSKNKMAQLTVDMQSYTTQLLFNQAAQGLDAEASRLLAEKMGLISPATSIAMGMLAQLKSDLQTGKITLDEYTTAVRNLDASVRNLPANKDINITTHYRTEGQPDSGGGGYVDPGTGSTYTPKPKGAYGAQSEGLMNEQMIARLITGGILTAVQR
jgi:DNA-binding MarR family transcriptional regulator